MSLELLTQAPLFAGAGLTLRTKKGMRMGVGAGVLPGLYIATINDTATSLDLYPKETATLIEGVLARSLVMTAQVGWGGADGSGFFVDLGYAVVALGGSASGQEALGEMSDVDITELAAAAADQDYAIDSMLHMVRVEVGWIWRLGARVDLRASIGGAFTAAAQTTITPPGGGGGALDRFRRRLAKAAEDELDATYTRDVHTPTAGLALSWRMF